MPDTTLYNDIKNQIAGGRIVIIAGTGVSVAASGNPEVNGEKVATWPGLIRHGTAWCLANGYCDQEEADILNFQVRSSKTAQLISAAQRVTDLLRSRSAGIYLRWLTDTVGSLRLQNPEIVSVLASMPGILATLNYDSLIEDGTRRRTVTWMEQAKVQRVLRESSEDYVLHLHGHFESPDSVVLGLESYLKVKNDPHTQTVLGSLTMDRTLVFVGCSGTLEDPNFTRLIEWGEAALANSLYRHFVLCRKGEIEALRKLTQNAPWLFPLEYGVDHSDLLPFLQSLAPAGTAERSASVVVDRQAPADASPTSISPLAGRDALPEPNSLPARSALAADIDAVIDAVQGAQLTIEQRFALVGAIAALPRMQEMGRRNEVVSLLGDPIASSVPYDSQTRSHVLNIVSTCFDYSGGLTKLYRALEQLYPGSQTFNNLTQILVRIHSQIVNG